MEVQIWRRALKGELAWRAASRGMSGAEGGFLLLGRLGKQTVRKATHRFYMVLAPLDFWRF